MPEEINFTNKLEDVLKEGEPLKDLSTDFDKNKDGKVSLMEFFTGLMKFPKYLSIFASVISGLYGLYKIISGWAQQNMDLETIIFLIALSIGALILFLGLNGSGKNTTQAIEKMRVEFKDTLDSKDRMIQNKENIIADRERYIKEQDDKILTLTSKNAYYEWAFKFMQNTNPGLNIPNPTQ
jgi:hypothetical protein